ncbi:MAG TPA: hypothetical protein VH165_23095, partial [Kofleriaceae bacterium]|nr:hypothetical protein [Kofleriaceae bacterium]
MLGLALLGACSSSLFDDGSHKTTTGGGGGDDDDGGGGPVRDCKAPCFADGAGDFNGTPGGATGHWRYLDDHRDRTWTPMTASAATMMTGADPGNHITTCAANPSAAACAGLPGALLVSSAGATSMADPALELTTPTSQVMQLSIHAFIPGGGNDQQIRIYRNSREDVLFTGTAAAGTTLDQAVTFDALAGDRF